MEKGKIMWVILLLALVFNMVECFEYHEKDLESEESLWNLYERWRSHHTVSYDLTEKQARFNVFKENLKHIHKVNHMGRPYKLKLNQFADMTNHEFLKSYAGSKVGHYRMFRGSKGRTGGFMHDKTDDLPNSIDWRKKGAVTGVKNQGSCGSCWAFSTVVAVEGINHIKTKQLVSLSEQELVDCNSKNNGCDGGLMEYGFDFIKENKGITTEKDYPYRAKDSACVSSQMKNAPQVTIDGYENVPENDEDALMKAVSNQPVSIAIDAGGKDFQFYAEGVFNGPCGTELNHGVAAVGYGITQDGTKYWIIKNSWGTEWGESGYIRMQRGVEEKEGLCGIAMEASYPIKSSPNSIRGTSDNKDKEEL